MRAKNLKRLTAINTIGEIMISRVVVLTPQDTVFLAAKKLANRNIGVVPVVQRGRLVGILSERDFVTKVIVARKDPPKTLVSSVMTKRLFTARPEDPIAKVIDLMQKRHIRHIPVIDRSRHVLGIVSLRDLARRMEENLKSLIKKSTRDLCMDPLTGLYNYRFFNDYLDAEITRSHRRGYHFCLLFMDLDYFKVFNDTHGHHRGNLLLKEFAKDLRPSEDRSKGVFSVRRSDIAVRLGGDEFVLVLPETIKAGAKICAERLRKNVEQKAYGLKNDKREYHTAVSIGVAEFPTDATKKEDLIEKADQALYKAKRLGRNRVQLFNS